MKPQTSTWPMNPPAERWFASGPAIVAFSAPIYMFTCSYLSMNSVEPVIWMGCALLLLRILRTGETRLWLAFGALGALAF